MSGLFDFFKKKQPSAPPEEFSGYEEEGSRPTEVQTPSEFDNFKFGLQGGNKGNAPGSWGELGGRVLGGMMSAKRGPNPSEPSQKQPAGNRIQNDASSAFTNIKRILGL